MKNNINIEIHNQEVREIMKEIPGKFIRYGLLIIFLIFSSIIIGSYFFKSREIISIPITIVSKKPPAKIVLGSTGIIDSIFVENGGFVHKGDTVAIIENEVLIMNDEEKISFEYIDRLYEKSIILLIETNLSDIDKRGVVYTSERKTNDLLLKEIEPSEGNYLQKIKLIAEILGENNIGFKTLCNSGLCGDSCLCGERIIISSPISGKINFYNTSTIKSRVLRGTCFAEIVPVDINGIICKAYASSSVLSKIEKGQFVNIKINGYSFVDYGVIRGYVSSISLIKEERGFPIEISLNNGLVSNYGNQIKFINGMDGTADICVNEMRMIFRLINPLKMLFNK